MFVPLNLLRWCGLWNNKGREKLGHFNATRTAVHPLIRDQIAALHLLNMLITYWFSVWDDVMHLESNRQLTSRDNCTNDAVLLLQMGWTVSHTAQVKLHPVGFPLLYHLVFSSWLPPQDQFYIFLKLTSLSLRGNWIYIQDWRGENATKSLPSR